MKQNNKKHLRDGGTVSGERSREADLHHELLGGKLVAIISDVAIVISISGLAHVQVHGVTGLIGTAVRVIVSVVVAAVIYKEKEQEKCLYTR